MEINSQTRCWLTTPPAPFEAAALEERGTLSPQEPGTLSPDRYEPSQGLDSRPVSAEDLRRLASSAPESIPYAVHARPAAPAQLCDAPPAATRPRPANPNRSRASGPRPAPPESGNRSGQAAYELARHYQGRPAASLTGRLAHFRGGDGQGNKCCADFVSSVLQNTGRMSGHYMRVPDMEQAMQHHGWHQIPGTLARPGDVWIQGDQGHTELVAAQGGRETIGSNNNGDRDYQTITQHPQNPRHGRFYTR